MNSMLNSKKLRLLDLLDDQISKCKDCDLYKNGRARPHWSEHSKFVILGEAPGYSEIRLNKPFIGKAGEILKNVLGEEKFKRDMFLIINSVNCRPVTNGSRNGKPTNIQLESCSKWLRKYFKIIDPEKILVLGNYAKYFFTGDMEGITRQRGSFRHFRLDNTTREYPVLFTIHPAYAIYNPDAIKMLEEDVRLFRRTKFSNENPWMFDEDDFKLD